LQKKPDYADAYYAWGFILAEQKQYTEAIKKYQEAIAKKPDYADAYYNWGFILAGQDRYLEAIEKFQITIQKKQRLFLCLS